MNTAFRNLKKDKKIVFLGSSLTASNANEGKVDLIQVDTDVCMDDVLLKIDKVYERTELLDTNIDIADLIFLNNICFGNAMLYVLLSDGYKAKIIHLLSFNFIFFSKFISNDFNVSNTDILYNLIYENDTVLANHFKDILKSNLDKRQLLASVKSLYFGSKVFNKLLDLNNVNIFNYVARLFSLYYELITSESQATEFSGDFLLHIIKLNPSIVMEQFFIAVGNNNLALLSNKGNFEDFFMKKIYKDSNTITKKKLSFEISKFLSKIANKKNYYTIYYILKRLNPVYLDFDRLLTYCKNEIFIFAYIKACSISHTKRLLRIVIMKWANSAANTKLNFETDDLLLTKLILICSKKLEDEDPLTSLESQYAHDSVFLNGISKRLINPLPMIVERTMIVAKRLTNNKVNYETSTDIEFFDGIIEIDKEFDDLGIIELPEERKGTETEVVKLEEKMNNVQIFSNEPLTDDINKRIYFIKDFVKQLLSVSSNSTSVLSVIEVLNEGCKLMELKLKHNKTQEIRYYLVELLNLLIKIQGRNEEEDFKSLESYRIRSVVCVIKAYPSKALDFLLETLFSKELSIQPRLSILTSIGIGCLEIINDSLDEENERIFHNSSTNNDFIVHEHLIKKTQTIWRSKKLDLAKQRSTQKSRRLRSQNTMIVIKVCYALVAGWFRGIDLGPTFDKLFKEHYLKCLSLAYSLVNDEKHLDPNKDLENDVKTVLLQAFQQGIMLDKSSLEDTALL